MNNDRIIYGNLPIDFEVIQVPESNSKLKIHVHYDGSIQVVSPKNITPDTIRDGVRKRARWISKHLDMIDGQRKHLLPRKYISGESHFYLGKRYPLKILSGEAVPSVKLLRGRLHVYTNKAGSKSIKNLLIEWYRQRATDVFERRYKQISKSITWLKGEKPSISLRNMTRQWGSCSPKGNILLNPHLVKAPRDCIDYVILHELCHLQEHNHSQKFYRLLTQSLPSWELHKTRLDHMAELLLNN